MKEWDSESRCEKDYLYGFLKGRQSMERGNKKAKCLALKKRYGNSWGIFEWGILGSDICLILEL